MSECKHPAFEVPTASTCVACGKSLYDCLRNEQARVNADEATEANRVARIVDELLDRVRRIDAQIMQGVEIPHIPPPT